MRKWLCTQLIVFLATCVVAAIAHAPASSSPAKPAGLVVHSQLVGRPVAAGVGVWETAYSLAEGNSVKDSLITGGVSAGLTYAGGKLLQGAGRLIMRTGAGQAAARAVGNWGRGLASRVRLAPKTEPIVFRQGKFADDAVGRQGNIIKGRQWATDNPLSTPGYAQRYGLPAENTGRPDWVVSGRVQGPYTLRPAPPSYNNPLNRGGATELVPRNPNSVRLDWFHMPD